MRLTFDEWKETVFKKDIFQDSFEIGKSQKIAATISGVRSSIGTFSHGFFTHKKATADAPDLDLKNKPDNKPDNKPR